MCALHYPRTFRRFCWMTGRDRRATKANSGRWKARQVRLTSEYWSEWIAGPLDACNPLPVIARSSIFIWGLGLAAACVALCFANGRFLVQGVSYVGLALLLARMRSVKQRCASLAGLAAMLVIAAVK